MSSQTPSLGELDPAAQHALELLLRAPDPRGAEVAAVRDTFCRAVAALKKRGVGLPQVILMVEGAARDMDASPDAVLAVVGLCADDFEPRGFHVW